MRRVAMTAAAVFIMFLVGCAAHMRDPREPNASLVYGYIDMDGAPSPLNFVSMRQYKPTSQGGRPYREVKSVGELFWFDQLTPGSYQITGFGGHAACLNISHIYSLPDFAKNQTAMTVEKPGLYFIGAFEYKREESFGSDKFSLIRTDSPSEKEVLEMLLPYSTGTQWEAKIKKRMGTLK